MKNKMFNKKNMKIIIPVIVLIVLLIVVIIFYSEYQYNHYRDKRDYKFYQYFAGQKIEYEATVSFNKKEVIKGFSPKEIKINYETIPIYYQEESKVIFPSQMSIVFPLKNDFQFKIPDFSYIEKVNNIYYLTYEDYHQNLDHFVIFDGDSLYLFSDSVTFKLNEEEITLSPLSYIISKTNELTFYDYDSDTYTSYDGYYNITVTNDFYTLDVRNDSVDFLGDRIILTNDLDYLSVLEEK